MGMTFLGLAQGSIQLVPDGTLLIHVGLILVMMAVLNRNLFRPINKILQRREMMGEKARDEAARISALANKRVAEYEAALRKARGDGYREAELARLQGLSESESKLSSTREEIKKLVHMEKLALEDESDQARRVLAAEAEAVAVEIRNRILKSSRSDG